MSFTGTMLLYPTQPQVPFNAILDVWCKADLGRRAYREALERIIGEHQLPASYFDLDELDRGGLAATSELLSGFFGRPRSFHWTIQAGGCCRRRCRRRTSDSSPS